MRTLLAAALCAVLVSGAQAAPGTGSRAFTIRLDTGAAPLIAGRRVGTFAQAVRAFGRPARISPAWGPAPACRALWPTLGLTIDFSIPNVASCSVPNLGGWIRVTATGPRWHTVAGLHVGDSEGRRLALYPQSRRLDFLGLGHIWELETGGPLCDGGSPLSLGARVRSGRVTALTVLHVPACH